MWCYEWQNFIGCSILLSSNSVGRWEHFICIYCISILRVNVSNCCGLPGTIENEKRHINMCLKTALMEVTEWFHHLTSGQPSKLEQKDTQRHSVMADAQTVSFSATAELGAFPLLWATESGTKAHGAWHRTRAFAAFPTDLEPYALVRPQSTSIFLFFQLTESLTHVQEAFVCHFCLKPPTRSNKSFLHWTIAITRRVFVAFLI